MLDGDGEGGGDVGTLGGDVKDGKTGGGQGGVNKAVPVTAGFFFVGGIVEFDDQDRAEFVAGAQDEIHVLGLDAVEMGLPVGCSLRHVNEVGESDFGEHEQLAIQHAAEDFVEGTLGGGKKVVFLPVGQVRSSGRFAGTDQLQENRQQSRDEDHHHGENYQEAEFHFILLPVLDELLHSPAGVQNDSVLNENILNCCS
ncbi:MAG: hypothetical protein PCFJNLEI_04132 [Verrucomicrobiae bacterium]|nr:hypothetical protein [Verrucomicrobiae bacterium]